MPIRYLRDLVDDGKYTISSVPFPRVERSVSGYGYKLSTGHIVNFKVDGKKFYRRIWATCYSNVASNWVMFKGDKFYVS
jgi:hypothetical protein